MEGTADQVSVYSLQHICNKCKKYPTLVLFVISVSCLTALAVLIITALCMFLLAALIMKFVK